MNVEQAIQTLYELKIKDKMSVTQREALRGLLLALLSTPEGVIALKEQLTPTILFSRKITQALVEEIQRRLERNESELREPILKLLTYIARGDKIDSASLWLAISVYLKCGPPEAPRLLAEVLDTIPQKDLEDRYEKYGFPVLNPDGGLPFLLALMLDPGSRPYAWLSGLSERIANRIWKSGQTTDASLVQVQTYLTRLSQMNPVRFTRTDRPLLLLAMAHMERLEGLRELLETLLRALPDPDPSDQAQRDWRPIIAQRIKERLENKPSPLPFVLPPLPAPPPLPEAESREPEAPEPPVPLTAPALPPKMAPAPMYAPPVSARLERSSLKTAAPELAIADLDQLSQQLMQGAEKLRAFRKEYAEMKETVKTLEEKVAASRDTIESLELTLKERDRKIGLLQAKLSATQEQYLASARQIERLQKRYDLLEGSSQAEVEAVPPVPHSLIKDEG